VSPSAADYEGEYLYSGGQENLDSLASVVVLRRDSVIVEVHVDRITGEVTLTRGRWYLANVDGTSVVFDNFSHPIGQSRGKIRLGINDDLDEYYLKVR